MQRLCFAWNCYPWPAPLYHIFPHYLINGTIFGKCSSIQSVFWFYLKICPKHFSYLRRTERDITINVCRSSCKVRLYCHVSMKLKFFRRIFEKFPNIRFNENLSSGSRVAACGQTERQTRWNKKLIFAVLRTRLKTNRLQIHREITAVCSQIHTKHINTVCGQNVELFNVKLAVHIVTTGL